MKKEQYNKWLKLIEEFELKMIGLAEKTGAYPELGVIPQIFVGNFLPSGLILKVDEFKTFKEKT